MPHPLVTLPGLFCDGGVIGPNPSSQGGTWAYTLVDKDNQRIKTARGLFLPSQAPDGRVSNNHTELAALVYGIESLPEGWVGTVYSDSWVSLQRVFMNAKLKNVPDWLVERLRTLIARGKLQGLRFLLLNGHPTRAELESGIGKRGLPTSEHNVYVDALCTELAVAHQRGETVHDKIALAS